MNIWIPYKPNQPKRNRKRNKRNEAVVPSYLPDNNPVAHTTWKGRGWVGRLIKPKGK